MWHLCLIGVGRLLVLLVPYSLGMCATACHAFSMSLCWHRLYQICGTLGAEFAAAAYFGPSHRAIQRYRQQFDYPMRYGWHEAYVSICKRLLTAWALDKAPCVIVEDSTALQARYCVM